MVQRKGPRQDCGHTTPEHMGVPTQSQRAAQPCGSAGWGSYKSQNERWRRTAGVISRMTRWRSLSIVAALASLIQTTSLAQSEQNDPTFCEWYESRLLAYAEEQSFSFSQEQLDSMLMGCDPQVLEAPESDIESIMDSFMQGWNAAGARHEAEAQARREAEAQARREEAQARRGKRGYL